MLITQFVDSAVASARKRAAQDTAFQSLCLSSPAEALKALGLDVPDEADVWFYLGDAGQIEMAATVAAAQDALSDSELDSVAGGAAGPFPPCSLGLTTRGCSAANICGPRRVPEPWCRFRRY